MADPAHFTSRLEAAAQDLVAWWDEGGSLRGLDERLLLLQERLMDYEPTGAIAKARARLNEALECLVQANDFLLDGGTDNPEIRSIRDDLAEEIMQIAKDTEGQ